MLYHQHNSSRGADEAAFNVLIRRRYQRAFLAPTWDVFQASCRPGCGRLHTTHRPSLINLTYGRKLRANHFHARLVFISLDVSVPAVQIPRQI